MSAWGRRVCCACGNDLDSDEFSRNQWAKGVGISRCSDCVKEGITEETKGFRSSGRESGGHRNCVAAQQFTRLNDVILFLHEYWRYEVLP